MESLLRSQQRGRLPAQPSLVRRDAGTSQRWVGSGQKARGLELHAATCPSAPLSRAPPKSRGFLSSESTLCHAKAAGSSCRARKCRTRGAGAPCEHAAAGVLFITSILFDRPERVRLRGAWGGGGSCSGGLGWLFPHRLPTLGPGKRHLQFCSSRSRGCCCHVGCSSKSQVSHAARPTASPRWDDWWDREVAGTL